MDVLGVIVVAVLLALGVRWLIARSPKRRERAQLARLLADCDVDRDVMERLVFAEMQRDEGIGFGEAARRARNRLRRDRR